MLFIRSCSFVTTFTPPKAPDTYSKIQVTMSQDDDILINKGLEDLECDETRVIFRLSQEETKLFTAGIPAEIQIKCFQTTYDAPGSAVFSFPVYDALNDNILGGE